MCRCKEQASHGAEAEHGSDYQRARQQYLRTLAADPLQPRYVRGWATQEANRLARIATARTAGQRAPGGDPYRYKGVPGYDVGHQLGKHGQHAPANFRLEWARDNRARPGYARSLGVQHKWREFEAELEQAAEAMAGWNFQPGRKARMVAGIRQIEGGAPRPLNRSQGMALLANLSQVMRKNIPLVKSGRVSVRSLQSQVDLPRWTYLRQFPNARRRFLEALQGTGVVIPATI